VEKHTRILILSPHVDDGELGCGATINRFIQEGKEVVYVAFSLAEESIPTQFTKETTEIEVKRATFILGIAPSNLLIYKFPVRNFPEFRQNILDSIIKLRDLWKPDLVFLPCSYDTHQDHKVIYEEGFRAFKHTSMFGYELPNNNRQFSTDVFININEFNVKSKIDAIKEYESQGMKPYMTRVAIMSLALLRGIQSGNNFAECFEAIRWVIK